ncbi:MAG: FHIPEP family type III secretion protein [Thermoguttaceae bacterium]|nr:FHIPEP family type III secretion protein [Thermoguttaceae bacterium]
MNGLLKSFHWRDAALPAFATVSVLAILFRLPNGLMDLLLSFNLALAATVFITTFFIRKPIEFSAFPTVLLTTTLFRLVLNVSTTRLILTQGDAGEVIDAFSRFVAGGNLVVGGVIFLIFIIIQFVVITKGATRISEVSARFTLDALPGRQSAIDFDLNAGNITEEEAKAAREELAEQSDFFGAMDGASKFVRGDAIAGLAIVAINIIGGLCIGVAQRGLSIGEAAELYSKLTIGDGLVSQIPAFLISMATGLLVARSSRSQNVSNAALVQTFGRPIVLIATGIFLAAMAFTGMPVLPLVTLACGCFALAWATSRKSAVEEPERGKGEEKSRKTGGKKKNGDDEDVEKCLNVDPMTIEIGVGLVPIADPDDGPSLLERVRSIRRAIASELGLALPKVRVRDDAALDENQFAVLVRGDRVALGVAYPQLSFAVDPGFCGPIRGLQTTAPGSGARAYWIDDREADVARAEGYEIWTPGDVVEKTALDAARREAANLLTRDAAKRLIERLRETEPALVAEALGENEADDKRATVARLARIQNVLQALLRERVSIRRLDAILEALGDLNLSEPDADLWRALEYVRARMARFLSAQYQDADGALRVVMLEPETEDALAAALGVGEAGAPTLILSATDQKTLARAVADGVEAARAPGVTPVVLTGKAIRFALRDAVKTAVPDAAFLAFDEVGDGVKISREATVDWRPNA